MKIREIVTAAMFLLNAAASADEVVNIELNKLETQKNACRAYLVFKNSGKNHYDEFKLDLVLFAQDGIIAGRLAVDAAPLRATKTTVKLFDIAGIQCASVHQVLINDIVGCRSSNSNDNNGDQMLGCIDIVVPSSRATATLIK